MNGSETVTHVLILFGTAGALGVAVSLALTVASMLNYTRTGPALQSEMLAPYRLWMIYCLFRHAVAVFAIASMASVPGILCLNAAASISGLKAGPLGMFIAGGLSAGAVTAYLFASDLVFRPSSLVASWPFDILRLNRMWRKVSPMKLWITRIVATTSAGLLVLCGGIVALGLGNYAEAAVDLLALMLGALFVSRGPGNEGVRSRYTRTARSQERRRYNVVMIGADTLRSDKIAASEHGQSVSPFLNELVSESWMFETCFVPLARTAPSLISLMTGLWPFEHAVRDNFLTRSWNGRWRHSLGAVLRDDGYRTCAISDWAGADLGKYDLGFDQVDVPEDQWNLKYCIRQGQQMMRLFLSLFVSNAVGRRLLPEVYYQVGSPLTGQLVASTKQSLDRLSESDAPFFLNVFMGGTHVPFGSEYPYYLQYASPRYDGDSKFAMATFRDPNEVSEKQAWPKEWFDTEQIGKLYDGCVRRFDDAVGEICQHLKDLELWDHTILVIYSDHGLEFFENETWGQGNSVHGYDHGSRIPLIIRVPGAGGYRIREQIRSIDLMPTVIELVGMDVPANTSGQSLISLVNGTGGSPRPVYIETGVWMGAVRGMSADHLLYPPISDLLTVVSPEDATLCIKDDYANIVVVAKDRTLRYGRWKLEYIPTTSGALYRLFDIVADPECKSCVSLSEPEVLADMKNRLQELLGEANVELLE